MVLAVSDADDVVSRMKNHEAMRMMISMKKRYNNNCSP
jgi:hypothetical protein